MVLFLLFNSLEKTRDFCSFQVTRFAAGNLFIKMKSYFLEFYIKVSTELSACQLCLYIWMDVDELNNINQLICPEEKKTRMMVELTSSLSDFTLKWLLNKNLSNAEKYDPYFVIILNLKKLYIIWLSKHVWWKLLFGGF